MARYEIPHPHFPIRAGERLPSYRAAFWRERWKDRLGLGRSCPGCRARPGQVHATNDCPQRIPSIAHDVWA